MRMYPMVVAFVALGACAQPEPTSSASPPPTESSAPAQDMCAEQGWTRRPLLQAGGFGSLRRDLAADFTVPTLQGDWNYFEQFTGCESIVFVPDSLVVSGLDSTPLLDSRADLRDLIETGPRNVHYFFVTTSNGAGAFADDMVSRVEGALQRLNEADAAWWQDRLHVVTQRADRLDAWVADAIVQAGPGFAIDRFQRIRGFGNLADVTRYSPELDGAGAWPWESNLAYLKHEVTYYNYESDRQDMLDATEWTSRYLFYEEDIASTGKRHAWVDLPDAQTMAGFDTLLVDLTHTCDPSLDEFGNCDAWDAVQTIFVCDEADSTSCGDLELARYITTYHREGRWLADASAFLPWLQSGGSHRLHLQGARSGHFVTARLLLGDRHDEPVPNQVIPLWEGGSFNESYDANHPPIEVDIPADATRVQLVVVVTGHGFGNTPNCAEFCDHQHTFSVGSGSFLVEHPNMGNQEGCLEQIGQGTVPNQSGTWWFERSSWCPGKQVDPWVFDITDQVQPGQTASLSYSTNYGSEFYGGSVLMRSWLSISSE